MTRAFLLGWALAWITAVALAVAVSAWSAIGARRRTRDYQRLWDEIDEALRA